MYKTIFNKILLLLLLLVPLCASAQKKQLSQAKDYIKSGKDLDKAESILLNQLKDSAQRTNLKVWQLLVDVYSKQYDQGNEQLYLKQKYDTLKFFTTTRKLFSTIESMDSVDAMPDEEGKVHPKNREHNAAYLKSILPNLYYGGVFLVNKKDYSNAYDYFNHCIISPTLPVFTGAHLDSTSAMNVSSAYWTMYCGFKLDSAELIMRHHELAERDTSQLAFVLQYEAEAYALSHDSQKYISCLLDGFHRYPKFPFFFPRIMEYYDNKEQYDSALVVVNKALAIDSASTFYRYAKSSVLLNMGYYDECISICDELIKEDANLADAYYNAGLSYFNMAVELDKERQRNRSKLLSLYRKALPYLEKYKELAPDRQDNWISPLYTIYLNLNMGKQFDEIDKIRHDYKRNHK